MEITEIKEIMERATPRQPHPDDWDRWLAGNPAPDLQALVTTFGGYANVPTWAWEAFDELREQWETARRSRLLGSRTWELMASWKGKRFRAELRALKKSTTAKEQKAKMKKAK